MHDRRTSIRWAIGAALVAAAGGARPALAQSIPGAVLAKREPHHHMVYEDATIRVLRVRVPPHDTTLLHEHDPDYFWVALGPSTLINVKPGSPDATVTSTDLAFHYAVGHFAHIARNPGKAPFDNITVELLEPQGNVRNLCEAALADKPLDCSSPAAKTAYFAGAADHPALSTSRLHVSLVTIKPGATLKPIVNTHPTWLIALDTLDAPRLSTESTSKWIGGTLRAGDGRPWSVKNMSPNTVRLIAVSGT